MKIAMWSGPRNLSTAMMYAFGNRAGFDAWDEPFYASYLAVSGIDHPMRDEILGAHETDAAVVSARIKGATGNLYMKHMTVHMIDGIPMDWAEDCVNVHLIRHPARVVASYGAKRESPDLGDVGFERHVEIYDRFPGPVLDSADIRRDPVTMLRRLCAEIGLDFSTDMLTWEAGSKSFDGIWAQHWYGAVHHSTGFAGAEDDLPNLQGNAALLADAALPFFDFLRNKATRLTLPEPRV